MIPPTVFCPGTPPCTVPPAPPIAPCCPVGLVGSYETNTTYDGWAWTLNYGYGAAPANDIVYGPDPGPPFPVMDETSLGNGNSIPGQTGTPLAFPVTFLTAGGGTIGPQPSPGVGGLNQPTWTTTLPSDVIGNTRDKVNWGLMTFTSPKSDVNSTDSTKLYTPVQPIDSSNRGDVTVIEDALRLKWKPGGLWPGLSVGANTPTKGAIALADTSLKGTWDVDPKKKCDRAYGVILCTDGESNLRNTGSPPNKFWDSTTTPCGADAAGTAFINFPPGAAEAMYLNARQDGAGARDHPPAHVRDRPLEGHQPLRAESNRLPRPDRRERAGTGRWLRPLQRPRTA